MRVIKKVINSKGEAGKQSSAQGFDDVQVYKSKIFTIKNVQVEHVHDDNGGGDFNRKEYRFVAAQTIMIDQFESSGGTGDLRLKQGI